MARLALALALLLAAGCARLASAPAPMLLQSELLTYAGEIPCPFPECSGQRLVLTLFPDGSFRLRRTYGRVSVRGDLTVYDTGRYARAPDDDARIVLRGGAVAHALEVRIVPPDRLRLLDCERSRVESVFECELRRQVEVDRIEGPMPLGGTYFYMADAASFVECLTGREYPVALEGDHVRLEREYLAQRTRPGERIGARFQGRFSLREPEPGAPAREHVVVERFVALSRNETCPGTVSLEGTHWRALEIDGEQVARGPGQTPPSFVIGRGRVGGFGGCNRFAGAFDPRGVLFRELVSTRMACPDAAGEVETRFLRALEAATAFTIMGTGLELRDAQNAVRMRLEATAELR